MSYPLVGALSPAYPLLPPRPHWRFWPEHLPRMRGIVPGWKRLVQAAREWLVAKAIAVTALTSGSAVTASSAVTVSFTHSTDALVLIVVYNHRAAATANAPTVTGHSLTWDQVNRDSAGDAATFILATTLLRSMGAGATGTATIDFAAQSQARIGWSVVEFGGVDTSGANGAGAVVQSVLFATNTAGTTMTITLAAFGSADNRPYAAWGVGSGTDPGDIAPEA